jgi:hypothetical protein
MSKQEELILKLSKHSRVPKSIVSAAYAGRPVDGSSLSAIRNAAVNLGIRQPPQGATAAGHPGAPGADAKREAAAEDLADADELEKAAAEWEAKGKPSGTLLEEVKHEFGVK